MPSRYSPGVTPTGLNPLAEALGRFGEGFERGRARRDALEQEAAAERRQQALDSLNESLAKAGLLERGFRPEEPDPDPLGMAASRSIGAERPPSIDPLEQAGRQLFGMSEAGGGPDPLAVTPDLFEGLQYPGRPAPAPTPGKYVRGQGFAGIQGSPFASPSVSIGGQRYTYDESRSPAALADQRRIAEDERKRSLVTAETEQQRARTRAAYIAAGMSPEEADAAVENPQLADNILFPQASGAGNTTQQIRARIQELRGQGLSLAQANQQARMEFGEAQPTDDRALVQVQQPDGSIVYIPREQAIGRSAPQRTAIGSAALKKAIAQNGAQLNTIDQALMELEKHKDAVGLKRGLGDTFNQRSDPEGVAARALIANVSSLIIHDRSGAAVTVAEMPRLKPFIPFVTDTYETVKTKFAKLKQAIAVENALLEEQMTGPVNSAPTTGTPAMTDPAAWLAARRGQKPPTP